MLQSTCFGTYIETGVDSKDDSGSQGQYREGRREVRGKMTLTVDYSEMSAKNVKHFVCVRERRCWWYWGKKCPFPSTEFKPVPLGYAPTVLPITLRGRHAPRQSKQTLQTLTRHLHRETIMHETLQLLSAGPPRQASARTSAESDAACQRKTKDWADGMREKRCPFPSTGFEPVPLGYAPTCVCVCVCVCVCARAHSCAHSSKNIKICKKRPQSWDRWSMLKKNDTICFKVEREMVGGVANDHKKQVCSQKRNVFLSHSPFFCLNV